MKSFFSKPFRDTGFLRALRKSVAFWQEILWRISSDSRVIIWKNSQYRTCREFRPKQFHPRTILAVIFSVYTLGIFGLALLTVSLGLIPHMNTQELHERAILTSIRLQEMADSLSLQTQYLANLQRLLSGNPDTVLVHAALETGASGTSPLNGTGLIPVFTRTGSTPLSIPLTRKISGEESATESSSASSNYLISLQLPAMPPVQGIITRSFNAEEGHYAIDIATSEGLMIRCIGDGYVIFSDWTYEGGHTIAVQHSDGYVSVYKHNQRLLKRTGDRVRTRESIAVSGDSGEYSSGPHLHFELWNNGLPQDPAMYLLGY